MAKKDYNWTSGAELGEHSKCKHKILKEYFYEYLVTRCKHPHQDTFKLAVIDGFSGAGLYKGDEYGSPLIFLDVLKKAEQEINLWRSNNKMKLVEIECYLVFNDLNKEAIKILKENVAPFVAEIKENHPNLDVKRSFYNRKFEDIYPEIKTEIQSAGYKNVLFNLDQCGYSDVDPTAIKNIMTTWNSAEVFLTFSISSIKTYLSPDQTKNNVLSKHPKIRKEIYDMIEGEELINKKEWLGSIETIIFENLNDCAPFVAPFSIHNPKGWEYWLMHFSNHHRARQVYNDTLHNNTAITQAHFGRAGLNMLSYDPQHEGQLYLFDKNSRKIAKKKLGDDIPRLIELITKKGNDDSIGIKDFYFDIYNETAAHSDDIHEAIDDNDDLEVITKAGGARRSADTIKPSDILRFKKQKSMFSIFKKIKNKI